MRTQTTLVIFEKGRATIQVNEGQRMAAMKATRKKGLEILALSTGFAWKGK